MVAFSDIIAANARIQKAIHKTPILSSGLINTQTNNSIFFKCENFQRIGAFKIRGAYNKIASLSRDELKRGVVAFSSGNHAQGVALASRMIGTTAKIVMPNNSPEIKLNATRAYGAEVIIYDFLTGNRELIGRKIAEDENRVLVPPFDDELIIAGQGTIGLEVAEKIKNLDYVFVPVGGGGLLAGNAISFKSLYPKIKVIGVETENANDAYQSFRKKEIVTIKPPDTIADGMRTLSLGKRNFEIILKYVDDILTVSDLEVIHAMEWIYSRLKIVVEPTAAVPFAAVMKNELGLNGKEIAVVLSGGNIDVKDFFSYLK